MLLLLLFFGFAVASNVDIYEAMSLFLVDWRQLGEAWSLDSCASVIERVH